MLDQTTIWRLLWGLLAAVLLHMLGLGLMAMVRAEPALASAPEQSVARARETERKIPDPPTAPLEAKSKPLPPRPAARTAEPPPAHAAPAKPLVHPVPAPPLKVPKELPPDPVEEPLRLGKDDAPEITTLAWISYEDHQQLVAPKSRTLQPIVQKQATPVPGAPLRIDAQDPGPVAGEKVAAAAPVPVPADAPVVQPEPTKPMEPAATSEPTPPPTTKPATENPVHAMADAMKNAEPPKPVVAEAAQARAPTPPRMVAMVKVPTPPDVVTEASVATDIGTRAKPEPKKTPEQESAANAPAQVTPEQSAEKKETPAPVAPATAPAPPAMPLLQPKETPAQPPQDAVKASAENPPKTPATRTTPVATDPSAKTEAERRLTSAPQSDKESYATMLESQTHQVKPGAVMTGPGIEIKTVVPRFSPVTRASALPENPLVQVTFDADGAVLDAKLLRSSNHPGVDAPLLSSMYKWTATGKALKEHKGPLRLTIELILVR